jgi:hypothetical protein
MATGACSVLVYCMNDDGAAPNQIGRLRDASPCDICN